VAPPGTQNPPPAGKRAVCCIWESGAGNFTRGLAGLLRELTAVETDGAAAAELQLLASRIAVRCWVVLGTAPL